MFFTPLNAQQSCAIRAKCVFTFAFLLHPRGSPATSVSVPRGIPSGPADYADPRAQMHYPKIFFSAPNDGPFCNFLLSVDDSSDPFGHLRMYVDQIRLLSTTNATFRGVN